MSQASVMTALRVFVILVAVWIGFNAIQGNDLRIGVGLVFGLCGAAGVLIAMAVKRAVYGKLRAAPR